MGYFHEALISAKIWEIRDEVAELRKEKRKWLQDQPLDEFELEAVAELETRIEELSNEHDKLTETLDFIRSKEKQQFKTK